MRQHLLYKNNRRGGVSPPAGTGNPSPTVLTKQGTAHRPFLVILCVFKHRFYLLAVDSGEENDGKYGAGNFCQRERPPNRIHLAGQAQ